MRYFVIIFVIIIICEIWYAPGAKRRRYRLRGRAKGFKLKRCDDCSRLINLHATFTVRNVKYRYAHVSTYRHFATPATVYNIIFIVDIQIQLLTFSK